VLALAAILGGCGGKERAEGLQIAKALKQHQADFASANQLENELINGARSWCASIIANGAGRGAQLEQNAAVAEGLAKSAVEVSNRLSGLRTAIADLAVEQEYGMGVRGDIITALTQRQRQLQELRALLQQIAPQFLEYKTQKNFAGDSYPGEIQKLDALLRAYSAPKDLVGDTLKALSEKYSFTAEEL
jgi:hypothetical protein